MEVSILNDNGVQYSFTLLNVNIEDACIVFITMSLYISIYKVIIIIGCVKC